MISFASFSTLSKLNVRLAEAVLASRAARRRHSESERVTELSVGGRQQEGEDD